MALGEQIINITKIGISDNFWYYVRGQKTDDSLRQWVIVEKAWAALYFLYYLFYQGQLKLHPQDFKLTKKEKYMNLQVKA